MDRGRLARVFLWSGPDARLVSVEPALDLCLARARVPPPLPSAQAKPTFHCEEFMDRNPRSWRLHCGLRLRYAVLSVAVAASVLAHGDALFAAPLTWIE